jgi:hypothetical protein
MDPLLSGAVNFIKVQVRAADLERAEAVLADRSVNALIASRASLALPDAEEPEADDGPDDYPPETEGERLVRFAHRAALMGFLACPPLLHVYSLFLLLRVAVFHGDLPPAANRRFYAAFLIDVAVIAAVALIAQGILSPPPDPSASGLTN